MAHARNSRLLCNAGKTFLLTPAILTTFQGTTLTTRRHFLYALPAATLALGATRTASAQAARLEETDAVAVSLGYKHDASKVDAKKLPAYAAGSNCANCQLYPAKATDPWGPCAAVGGKLVSAKGWCAAWVKKA